MDTTHPCCSSPCSTSTSNQSEKTPSSGRTQALTPSWNCRMIAIIFGGTPNRVSTCHKRVTSTASYAFWRSMKHVKSHTPAFRPISCSLRTANIMSAVERSSRNLHCSSSNSPLASQKLLTPSNHFEGQPTRVGHEQYAAVVFALRLFTLLVEYSNDRVFPLLWDSCLAPDEGDYNNRWSSIKMVRSC